MIDLFCLRYPKCSLFKGLKLTVNRNILMLSLRALVRTQNILQHDPTYKCFLLNSHLPYTMLLRIIFTFSESARVNLEQEKFTIHPAIVAFMS